MNGFAEFFHRAGLIQHVADADLARLLAQLVGYVAGAQNDRHVPTHLEQLGGELHAGSARHVQVGDDEIELRGRLTKRS